MADLQPGHWITLALAAVGFIAWLVRLESKANACEKQIIALEAKNRSDAEEARATRDAMIRVEERLKHLTDLVERLVPKRRAPE
jgi:hypothetical protein